MQYRRWHGHRVEAKFDGYQQAVSTNGSVATIVKASERCQPDTGECSDWLEYTFRLEDGRIILVNGDDKDWSPIGDGDTHGCFDKTEGCAMAQIQSIMQSETMTEVQDAAWRTAAIQVTDIVRKQAMTMLGAVPDIAREHVRAFAQSPYGTGLLAYGLGFALPHAPKVGGHAKTARLARELRVLGWTLAFNDVATRLIEPVSAAIVGVLSSMPGDE